MSDKSSVIDSVSENATRSPFESNWSGWSDLAGMVASVGCAIHCAAMPFVIAYLPSLGLSFLADEAFHKWMAVGCFIIALAAFGPGLRKHGSCTPIIVGSVGLVMISIAAFGYAGECCVACESDATSVGSAAAGASALVASPVESEGCTDASCTHCANESSAIESGDHSIASLSPITISAPFSASIGMVSRIAPWLTPIGGIVLVGAHLLNRRFGYLCGCCEKEPISRTK
jgi:hypothetical protein